LVHDDDGAGDDKKQKGFVRKGFSTHKTSNKPQQQTTTTN
jgi:hypothetical protein